MDEIVERFRNPGAPYRGKPFWAWNGRLEEGELRRQIRVMKEMGLGGFFMHSRVGLATPYLSEEWMHLTRACVDEAEKLGMEAWLYDEDRWPSGAAGGLVTRDERYRQRRMQLSLVSPGSFEWEPSILAAWSGVVAEDRVRNLRRIPERETPRDLPAESSILVFRVVQAPPSPWYNGYTYLDTLSEEAVRKFIEVTHEAYRRELGGFFGGIVPGIFTDEPNHGLTCHAWQVDQASTRSNEIPWTPNLPEFFRDKYGYDIVDHLPELFFDVDGIEVSRARYDYHDCKTTLFVQSFARQIGEWCERNGIALTGHVLEEPRPSTQTNVVGSAMRFYEFMQAPGIDVLTEGNREYDTAKQCASVARQTGRSWVLSETYGCTGWDFPFEGHKAVGDWQAALGINLRCQHLAWYTMAGQAKRDYPAAIDFHSPWWRHYPVVEDYFARIGVLMTRGEPVRRLLVVHPLESTWIRCRIDFRSKPDVRELDARLEKLRDALLAASIDFDYGDEEMMSRLASVDGSQDRPVFRLGKADYDCVLVPEVLTLRSSTLELLRRFREAGGPVIFVGEPPAFVDARPSERAREAAAACLRSPADPEQAAQVAASHARVLSITRSDGSPFPHALHQLRREGDTLYLFVVNTDRQSGYEGLTIEIAEGADAEEWDPSTGERWRADVSREGEKLAIRTSLPPSGSRLFVVLPRESGLDPKPSLREREIVELGPGPWAVARDEPNVVVLDRPAWRIDDGTWRDPEEILRIDGAVRDHLGLQRRGGAMVQPWAREHSRTGPSCTVGLRYGFRVETPPRGAVWLAMEQPGRAVITLNGKPVESDPQGSWVDDVIRKIPLPPLQTGDNTIEMTVRFDEDADLESVFLLGDFGVRLDGLRPVITAAPERLAPGDWVPQGLPFYSAGVTYTLPLEYSPVEDARAFLVLTSWKGAVARVRVNGVACGDIAWQPYEVDVTRALKPGSNTVEIDLVSSRHNAFGPLHQAAPEPSWVGPENFTTTGERWQDEYQLRTCGLLEPPVLSIRVENRAE